MGRTANVFARVEPKIKEQAQAVLDKLGISMATAMEIYLRQIPLQRKNHFEVKFPEAQKPLAYGSLTDEEFNALMNKAAKSYADGKCTEFNNFKKEISKEIGL